MTAVDNPETTESAETPATEKNPTYFDLARAVWLLAYDLSPFGERDVFCVDGVDTWLRALDLPELMDDDERADDYLRAWFNWKNWAIAASGEISPEDDATLRANLARAVRTRLEREEPKPRATMNGWLQELGLEPLEAPRPPRHIGRYRIGYEASTEVNSAAIVEALREKFPTLNVEVTYDGRIA